MIRLRFVNQHYAPAYVSAGQYLTSLAERLSYEGFSVSVLCGRSGYEDEIVAASRKEVRSGVVVERLWMPDFGRSSGVLRVIDYLFFFVGACFRLMLAPRCELVVFLTTPPMINTLGLLVCLARRQPYAIWAMDLHPEIERELGIINKGGLADRALTRLDNASFQKAEFVVALGKCMQARILAKGVEQHRIVSIPLWDNKDRIRPRVVPGGVENDNGTDKLTVMYSGNAGVVHRFDEVLGAMNELSSNPFIQFKYVGGGPRRNEIVKYCDKFKIKNFKYMNYVSRSNLSESLAIGDVHLITLRSEMVGLVVPSKVYGIMAAGRAAIMIGPRQSEASQAILSADCGYVLDPSEESNISAKLVEILLDLATNRQKVVELGMRARSAFLARHEEELGFSEWRRLILANVLDKSGTVPASH